MKKNSKRIKLKTKKARKLFATSVSRGPNKKSSDKKEEKEEQESEDNNSSSERKFASFANFALMKQLDGALDFEEGSTSWCSVRASKGYGSILKKDYDLDIENTTKDEYLNFLRQPIPKRALDNAYMFRTNCYERLWNTLDIIKALPYAPIILCFDYFDGIYDAPNGVVPMPKFWQKSKGSHSVSIIGFDPKKRLLRLLNSWGREWGDNGTGYLSYDYVDKYLVEAWFGGQFAFETKIDNAESKNIGSFKYVFMNYHSVVYGRHPTFVFEAYDKDKIAGWAHFHFNDLKVLMELEIDDIFVKPEYRNKGIAKEILSQIEQLARNHFVQQIVCYLHIQDLVSEDNMSAIERLFTDGKYKIIKYTKKFRGCQYKVVGRYPFKA